MSANLILIPTALENGKEIATPRCLRRQATQKNDQNSNQPINSCTAIECWTVCKSFTQKPCSQTSTANKSIRNSSAINGGGAA